MRFIVFLSFIGMCFSTVSAWSQNSSVTEQAQLDSLSIKAQLVLSGNFSDAYLNEGMTSAISMLRSYDIQPADTRLVILGNLLPHNIPDHDSKAFDEVAETLKSPLHQLFQGFSHSYYIPGNNEWFDGQDYTVEGIKNHHKLVQKLDISGLSMTPSKGCGNPYVVEINDDLVLLLLDSQWMMQSNDNDERKKSSCEIDNNFELITELKEITGKYKHSHLVVATHHPMYSYGKLGGNFKARHHLLPFPVLGTILTAVRQLAVTDQMMSHPDYDKYRAALQSVLNNCGNCVVVSSHENNLQYRNELDNHFLTAGAGYKSDYTTKVRKGDFASAKTGIARLLLTQSGKLIIRLEHLESDGSAVTLFEKILPARVKPVDSLLYVQKSIHDDSIRVQASASYGRKRFLRGKFYRKAWAAPVSVPVLLLDTVHGGLEPIKQGGGFQTRSLRLENQLGRQWVLRSINKDVEKVVPPALRGSFAQKMVQDGIAASHPYGAFVIPELADAIGVMHANPKAVYLPYQEELGDYNNAFGNKLYLFEERAGGHTKHISSFGYADDVHSTPDLLELLEKSHKHKVDQHAVLNARLFDIWLGDWDRHDDQWRWAEFKEDDYHIYRPIPRDRDQVFFKNDGFLDYLVSRPYFNPGLRKFDFKIDYLPGLVFNARHFDRSFLNRLTREDFLNTAAYIQSQLTEPVISKAFAAWPDTIQKLDKEIIISKLIQRRDDLQDYAAEYYKILSREIDVPGTEDRDYFQVDMISKDSIDIKVYHKKEEVEHLLFSRKIDTRETDELRLFGLARDDQFELTGDQSSKICIRIIGGSGDDHIVNNSKFRVLAYDRPEGMKLEGRKITDNRKDINGINSYNRKDWEQDRFWHFPIPSFYTDEGLGLTYNIWWRRFGFRKEPYKNDSRLAVSYHFKNDAFRLKYGSILPDFFGYWDLGLNLSFTGPAFVSFYYGLGNQFIDFSEEFPALENAGDQTFHVVRGTHINANASFTYSRNDVNSFRVQPGIEYLDIGDTDENNRFYLTEEANIDSISLTDRLYPQLSVAYTSNRLDNNLLPRRGYLFEISATGRTDILDNKFTNLNLHTTFSSYIPFDNTKSLVLGSQVGYAHLIGNAEFFHYNYLSDKNRLRGFRIGRFAGERMIYWSGDLRKDILKSKGELPGVFGVLASFDLGRVWYSGDDSRFNSWHTSWGGGIYFAPFEQIGFKIAYYRGQNEYQLSLAGNLAF